MLVTLSLLASPHFILVPLKCHNLLLRRPAAACVHAAAGAPIFASAVQLLVTLLLSALVASACILTLDCIIVATGFPAVAEAIFSSNFKIKVQCPNT